MRIAILAHEQFPQRAKTAIGVMRYGPQEVAAVIDRNLAGTAVDDHTDLVADTPIVASMDDVTDIDALLIGIAPIGGEFVEDWRPDVTAALERGCDVISGLHTFLGDDPEFAAIAERTGATIRDVRRPPDDLTVAAGTAGSVDATVILTVGTDASVGKMTTSFELVEGFRAAGYDAAVVPTGQTGIMIADWGYPIDRVIADFMAGAVEDLVLQAGDDHDVLVVEGQGSLAHPAYSGVTCAILHGAMPDAMVLVHDPAREHVHGYEDFAIPDVGDYAALYESVAEPVCDATIEGGAVNTSGIDDDDAARAAVDDVAKAIDAPATDVIRFGSDTLVETLK